MKQLKRAYHWLLIAPAVLPMVIWSGVIYPYLVPKTLLFYALTLLAASAFVLLAAHKTQFYWSRARRMETWIPAALLVLAYSASAAGLDFYRSFWSVLVRGDGLLMLTCAVVNFYLILLYADWLFFRRLLVAVAAIGSFVAAYGIGEWVLLGGRIGGLLGNAAFFAGYLTIAFFATLAAGSQLPPAWRRACAAGAALEAIAVILSATRGSILALVIAGIAALACSAFTAEGKRRVWPAGALIALLVSSGIFFAFRTELAQSSFTPLGRMATISVNDPDISSRLFIWKNMASEIRERPWLGVGAEHIDAVFNRFYDPTQIAEEWFDRSHNAFLDYAAQYGIGGLLLYAALIASFGIAASRFWRGGEKHLAFIIALLALAYAVGNFFVFDTISSFWLLLALLAAALAVSRLPGQGGDSPQVALALPAWAARASWPAAAVLVLLVIPVSVRPALAAYDLAQAYKYQLVDVSREVQYLSRGLARGTYGDLEYGYTAYDMYTSTQAAQLSDRARADAYQAARSILTTDFNRYPYDARTALYLAHVFSLAPPGVSVDGTLLSSALERAIRLSPKRSQPWYLLVNLSLTEANAHPVGSAERAAGYAAAKDLLMRYIVLVPALSQPHFVLAQLLYASGDATGAAAEAARGKARYTTDLATARRAAAYYENTFDLPNTAFFLGEVVRLDPSDTAAASDLAKIHAYERSKK